MTEVTAFPFGTSSREVKFQGVEITVIPGPDADSTLVAVKAICEHLGVDRAGQQRRIQANYPERWRRMSLPSAGGPQETFCIALSFLGLWLATIEVNKVRPDRREALKAFQERCARAIYEDIHGPAATEAGQQALSAVLPAAGQEALWAAQRDLNAKVEQLQAALVEAWDLEEATDLVLLADRRIACRIRSADLVRYARQGDFTIRLTELPKILNGHGDFYFFGVARDDVRPDRGLWPWAILDLQVFRRADLKARVVGEAFVYNTLEYSSPIVVAHEGWGEASWRTRVRRYWDD